MYFFPFGLSLLCLTSKEGCVCLTSSPWKSWCFLLCAWCWEVVPSTTMSYQGQCWCSDRWWFLIYNVSYFSIGLINTLRKTLVSLCTYAVTWEIVFDMALSSFSEFPLAFNLLLLIYAGIFKPPTEKSRKELFFSLPVFLLLTFTQDNRIDCICYNFWSQRPNFMTWN